VWVLRSQSFTSAPSVRARPGVRMYPRPRGVLFPVVTGEQELSGDMLVRPGGHATVVRGSRRMRMVHRGVRARSRASADSHGSSRRPLTVGRASDPSRGRLGRRMETTAGPVVRVAPAATRSRPSSHPARPTRGPGHRSGSSPWEGLELASLAVRTAPEGRRLRLSLIESRRKQQHVNRSGPRRRTTGARVPRSSGGWPTGA
jgi:hypothetical protein